jgi:VanZ family protein
MKLDTINTLARAFLLLLVVVVLYLTLTPNPPHVPLDNLPYGDKIEHFTAFGALAVAARLGFMRLPGWQLLEHLSFLGAMIEVAQATPGLGRDCDWHDWLADTGGAAVALGALHLLLPYLLPRQPAAPSVTLH